MMKIKEPKHRHNTVMLIDDNDLDNFINEKMLEVNHFAKKIYINSSAKSALEFFENMLTMNSKCDHVYPEVLFIDINMPMMDGFQFIETFKKNFGQKIKQPKLVILTSSLSKEDREKANRISKDIVFLNKPLTATMLSGL